MPRRHQRNPEATPLAITPADLPRVRRFRTREEVEAEKDATADRRRAQLEAHRRRRVTDAITDWTTCCIPGCETKANIPREWRDVSERLPVCTHHAVIIKQQIDPSWQDDAVVAERAKRQARLDEKADAYERAATIAMNGGSAQGQLYFVRLNGLVKVGWSSDLIGRLKAYGPDVEILCHYPGSRQDETLMHRQLRPYLAKGREWYQDCPLIADVVAGIVMRHGPPHLSAFWTQPKADPIKLRNRGA